MAAPGRQVVDPVSGAILETPELRERGLRELRGRMDGALSQGKVARYPRTDDQFLLAFLRARKYNVERAFEAVNNFAAFWFDPENRPLLEGLCAEKAKRFAALKMMQARGWWTIAGPPRPATALPPPPLRHRPAALVPAHPHPSPPPRCCSPHPPTRPQPPPHPQFMKGLDVHGNRVVALHFARMNAEAFSLHDQMLMSLYLTLDLFGDDQLQLHGATYVETMEGFSLGASMALSRRLDSKEQKKLMGLMGNTVPLRIRSILLVHQPWYFGVFWAIARPFLHKKMAQRLRLLGTDFPALHALVPKETLPPEFGGTATEEFDWCAMGCCKAVKGRGGHPRPADCPLRAGMALLIPAPSLAPT